MSRWDRDLVVDLCDFESYQHTLPLASRGNDEMALQDSVLGPESVFIDVGANQGLFSVHAATLIGRGGRILSIEPNARLASALRRTKLLNDFDQMEVVESAVGDTSGVQDFFIPGLASGVGSIFASHAAQASVSKRTRVTIDTLDNLVKAAGLSSVDLIKIDVEGAELLVFQGAAETIRNHRPLLWFEINPQALRTAGLSPADLLEAIKTLGYSSVYELGSVVRGERRPIDDFTKLNNAVAMHEDRLIDFGANKRRT
ncbi:FkbM family methyltransferase [Thiocapsa roseopersicina]|nr:FkbM family methyltransferase [Thiocapsa roseopersicina]